MPRERGRFLQPLLYFRFSYFNLRLIFPWFSSILEDVVTYAFLSLAIPDPGLGPFLIEATFTMVECRLQLLDNLFSVISTLLDRRCIVECSDGKVCLCQVVEVTTLLEVARIWLHSYAPLSVVTPHFNAEKSVFVAVVGISRQLKWRCLSLVAGTRLLLLPKGHVLETAGVYSNLIANIRLKASTERRVSPGKPLGVFAVNVNK